MDMKKVMTLLCAAMIALSLAACGGQAPAPVDGNGVSAATSASAVAPQGKPEMPYAPGEWTGDTYNDLWADVSFTLPEDWMALTAEESELIVGELPETDTISFCVTNTDLTGVVFLDVVDLEAAGSTDLTAEQFAGQLQLSFKLDSENSYEITGPEDGEFAGIPCKKLTVRESGSGVTQTYYVTKKDARMLAFATVAAGASAAEEVAAFVASIQPAQIA